MTHVPKVGSDFRLRKSAPVFHPVCLQPKRRFAGGAASVLSFWALGLRPTRRSILAAVPVTGVTTMASSGPSEVQADTQFRLLKSLKSRPASDLAA